MGETTIECVLLADRHHALSESIRGLLETVFGGVFVVADEASLGEGAARIRPSVVVVDLSLAGGDLRGLLRTLRGRAPATKVILLSVHDEPTVIAAAEDAGADALVLKRSIGTDLLPAIAAVLAGHSYCSATSRRREPTTARSPETPRDTR